MENEQENKPDFNLKEEETKPFINEIILSYDEAEFKEENQESAARNQQFHVGGGSTGKRFFKSRSSATETGCSSNASTRHAPIKHVCNLCKKEFLMEKALKHHKLISHLSNNNPFTCDFCGSRCPTSRKLTAHRKSHFSAAGKTVSKAKKSHWSRIKSGEKPFSCNICDQKFAVNTQLLSHFETHTPESVKSFSCDVCQMKFLLQQNFEKHRETAHRTKIKKERLFASDICKVRFHSNDHLIERNYGSAITVSHKNKQTLTKHVCSVCNKRFRKEETLLNHQKHFHHKEPIACQICKITFTTISSLQIHTKTIHEGERPYLCEICGSSFAQRSGLTGHMRTHGENKVFKCEICKKKFTTASILKQHLRKHTNERPYCCDSCGKMFRYPTNLANHQKVAHCQEKPYSCSICLKTFALKYDLQQHSKMHGEYWPRNTAAAKSGDK